MTTEPCIECGHTPAQHESVEGDCDGCFDEERAIICDKWRDEPRGAGDEPDGERFRGGEAAAFMRDQQIAAQRLK
jgi:hypothetical protein